MSKCKIINKRVVVHAFFYKSIKIPDQGLDMLTAI